MKGTRDTSIFNRIYAPIALAARDILRNRSGDSKCFGGHHGDRSTMHRGRPDARGAGIQLPARGAVVAGVIKEPRAYIGCRYELLPEVSLPLVSGRVQPMARGYPMATKQAYLKGKEKGEDSQLRSPTLLSR